MASGGAGASASIGKLHEFSEVDRLISATKVYLHAVLSHYKLEDVVAKYPYDKYIDAHSDPRGRAYYPGFLRENLSHSFSPAGVFTFRDPRFDMRKITRADFDSLVDTCGGSEVDIVNIFSCNSVYQLFSFGHSDPDKIGSIRSYYVEDLFETLAPSSGAWPYEEGFGALRLCVPVFSKLMKLCTDLHQYRRNQMLLACGVHEDEDDEKEIALASIFGRDVVASKSKVSLDDLRERESAYPDTLAIIACAQKELLKSLLHLFAEVNFVSGFDSFVKEVRDLPISLVDDSDSSDDETSGHKIGADQGLLLRRAGFASDRDLAMLRGTTPEWDQMDVPALVATTSSSPFAGGVGLRVSPAAGASRRDSSGSVSSVASAAMMMHLGGGAGAAAVGLATVVRGSGGAAVMVPLASGVRVGTSSRRQRALEQARRRSLDAISGDLMAAQAQTAFADHARGRSDSAAASLAGVSGRPPRSPASAARAASTSVSPAPAS